METLKMIEITGTNVKVNEIMNEITNVLTIIDDDFRTSKCVKGEYFENIILVNYRNIDFIINLKANMQLLLSNKVITNLVEINICPTIQTKEALYELKYTYFNPQNVSMNLYQSTYEFNEEMIRTFIKTNLICFMSNFDEAIKNTRSLIESIKTDLEETEIFINENITANTSSSTIELIFLI